MSKNERGFSTVYALFIMVVLLLLGGSLLPAASGVYKLTKINQSAEIAQAAAESGARRFIAELYDNAQGNDFPWLNHKQPLCLNQDGMQEATYLVNKTDLSGTEAKIVSTGEYQGAKRTITTTVTHKSSAPKSAFVYNNRLFAYGINKIIYDSNVHLTSGSNALSKTAIDHHRSAEIIGFAFGSKINLYAPNQGNINSFGISIINHEDEFRHLSYLYDDQILPDDAGVYYDYVEEQLFGKLPLLTDSIHLSKSGNSYTLSLYKYIDPGRYCVPGNLNIMAGALSLSRPGNAILYIQGDLTISGGRIGFCGDELLADLLAGNYAEPQYKNFLIIAEGNVTIQSFSGVNFATIVSYKNITVDGSTNLIGSIQAGHTRKNIDGSIQTIKDKNSIPYGSITVSGMLPANLIYDADAVLPFLDILSEIDSPPDRRSHFKVGEWRSIKTPAFEP